MVTLSELLGLALNAVLLARDLSSRSLQQLRRGCTLAQVSVKGVPTTKSLVCRQLMAAKHTLSQSPGKHAFGTSVLHRLIRFQSPQEVKLLYQSRLIGAAPICKRTSPSPPGQHLLLFKLEKYREAKLPPNTGFTAILLNPPFKKNVPLQLPYLTLVTVKKLSIYSVDAKRDRQISQLPCQRRIGAYSNK